MKIKDKHIERLTRSQKSGIRVGSRSIPHRLRKYERDALER